MLCRSSPIIRAARSCAAVFSLIMPAVMTKIFPPLSFMFSAWPFSSTMKLQRLVQLQVRVLPVRAVRLQVVNFREHAAQPADVNRLLLQFSLAHQQRQQRQHFLRAAQRKRRNQHAALAFERVVDGRHQPLDFAFAREKPGGTARLPRVVSMIITSAFTSSNRAARKMVWS